jgi:serine/threonine protein kinase
MSRECISILNGMLTLDPEERFTAMDCLAHAYFDPVREPEVDQMIANWRQAKHNERMNQDNHGESALN